MQNHKPVWELLTSAGTPPSFLFSVASRANLVGHNIFTSFVDRHKTQTSKRLAWRLDKSPCNSANAIIALPQGIETLHSVAQYVSHVCPVLHTDNGSRCYKPPPPSPSASTTPRMSSSQAVVAVRHRLCSRNIRPHLKSWLVSPVITYIRIDRRVILQFWTYRPAPMRFVPL